MSRLESLWLAYRELPRAGRWAVAAAIAIALILVWDKTSQVAAGWDEATDRLLYQIDEARDSRRRLNELNRAHSTIRALGVVQVPGPGDVARDELHDIVNEVLKRHSVTDDSFASRGTVKAGRDALRGVIPPGRDLEKITGELRFDAEADEAVAIIAELERSPEIESLSNVRLTRKAGARRMTVDVTVEAWIYSSDRSSVGLGGGA